MTRTREPLGHRRAWWQFHVIPLALALFAMVYVRHLTNLPQNWTIFCTLAIIAVWFLVGLVGVYMPSLMRAGRARRRVLVAGAALLLLPCLLIGYRSWWQARLINDIWMADGSAGGGNDVVFGKKRIDGPAEDPFFFYRCWGRVTEVEVDSRPDRPFDLSRLTALKALKSFQGKLDGAALSQLARLPQLEKLYLRLDGDADFSILKKLTRLRNVSVYWRRGENSNIQSLRGLPISGELALRDGPPLTDEDVDVLASLPLGSLYILNKGLLSSAALRRLRQANPQIKVWPESIADYPAEATAVEQLRQRTASLVADNSGRVTAVVFQNGEWTQSDAEVLAQLPLLTSVTLTQTEIGGPWFEALAECNNLAVLALTDCHFDARAGDRLRHLSGLRELILRGKQVTDAQLQYLATLGGLKRLTLEETQVTDVGLQQLERLASLRTLTINHAEISDQGVRTLAGLKHLREIQLIDVPVSDRAIRKLRGALPQCAVSIGEGW